MPFHDIIRTKHHFVNGGTYQSSFAMVSKAKGSDIMLIYSMTAYSLSLLVWYSRIVLL